MKVLIQLRSSTAVHEASTLAAAAPAVTSALAPVLSGFSLDPQFPPVQVPGVTTLTGAAVSSLNPAESTYVVRGSIPDGPQQAAALQTARAHPDVVGVFSDPLIESTIICP